MVDQFDKEKVANKAELDHVQAQVGTLWCALCNQLQVKALVMGRSVAGQQ